MPFPFPLSVHTPFTWFTHATLLNYSMNTEADKCQSGCLLSLAIDDCVVSFSYILTYYSVWRYLTNGAYSRLSQLP